MSLGSGGVLLLCYGNPGRLDDGLGAAFGSAAAAEAPAGVHVEVDYQLAVEHVAEAARYPCVVFVDAAASGPAPFAFRRLSAAGGMGFSTHSLAPEAVLAMVERLFGSTPTGYALAIRGYLFDAFGEELSRGARRNLGAALAFLLPILQMSTLGGLATTLESAAAAPWGDQPCETAST